MAKPKAILVVQNNQVCFRFQGVLPCHFDQYLNFYRARYPAMKWQPKGRVWELPQEQFQAIYETSRYVFGARNVSVVWPKYTRNMAPVQLSLFGKTKEE